MLFCYQSYINTCIL